MPYSARHLAEPPTREAVDALTGVAVLEFGTPWCPHCIGAQPLFEQALKDLPDVPHIKVEDGPGQRLGRSYKVKLWPTLVVLKDGQEVARTVRPTSQTQVDEALAAARA
jgi:thioredoxin 1